MSTLATEVIKRTLMEFGREAGRDLFSRIRTTGVQNYNLVDESPN